VESDPKSLYSWTRSIVVGYAHRVQVFLRSAVVTAPANLTVAVEVGRVRARPLGAAGSPVGAGIRFARVVAVAVIPVAAGVVALVVTVAVTELALRTARRAGS
jgi:hypothetical protein